ncbi:DUF1878 family protein [Gracilibacillus marinus]|jgi:hypothetical protein|uniref:DUF1878 family protein n=1 Tax=Gracilibacillus marinus TaxID=630535 RepID=A0ABV8VW15_9BACI
MDMEREFKKQQFHMYLLLSISNIEQHPLIRLLVENNISEREYHQLLALLDELDDIFTEWKEEGYLNFDKLLIWFVGSLCEKLDPELTIKAFLHEGIYSELMKQLLHLHDKYKKND